MQPTVALSSTEAEIRAGVATGKMMLYFWKLFQDLGFDQSNPTTIYEDNQGTIQVSNHNRPSGRTRHMAREFFASQEWVRDKLLIYKKIDGKVNLADALTKLLPFNLFSRHFERMFGHNGAPHAHHPKFLDNPNDNPAPK